MNYVYWIYSDDSLSIDEHGYVGVTRYLNQRFKTHLKKTVNVPSDAKLKIIYEGLREDCFKLEKQLRPKAGIGWNRAIGGSHGWRNGFSHNELTKEKMRQAWTEERKRKASILKTELNIGMTGQKRPNQSKAMLGVNNPMYNKSHSKETKHKMSLSRAGKPATNKIELYCVYCHKLANPTVLKKYHGLNKKKCISNP